MFFAFDVGQSIDLDRAEGLLKVATSREVLRHRRRTPAWFQYRPPPLRVTLDVPRLDGLGFSTMPNADLVLYDFGAASLAFTLDLAREFTDLPALGVELENDARLEAHAREHLKGLLEVVRPAIHRLDLAAMCESYIVMSIRATGEPEATPHAVVESRRALFARVLRSERAELSAQEVDDALSCALSYGPGDLALVDWSCAILFDDQPEDALSILEFANVQLLELRHLDNRLDDALDSAHAMLSQSAGRRLGMLGGGDANLRRVAMMQTDNAMLFESVGNALKLLGDAFLARLYDGVSARFHLADWQRNVTRKLQVLESIYGKLADGRRDLRMEVLEWIIIALIAISIVLPFVMPGAK